MSLHSALDLLPWTDTPKRKGRGLLIGDSFALFFPSAHGLTYDLFIRPSLRKHLFSHRISLALYRIVTPKSLIHSIQATSWIHSCRAPVLTSSTAFRLRSRVLSRLLIVSSIC